MKRDVKWVEAAVERAGVSWLDLTSRSEAVILFGSQAMHQTSPDSDIDLLVISPTKGKKLTRQLIGDLDIITLSPEETKADWWLGSELAFHISKYGKIIKGEASWLKYAFISEAGLKKKTDRISSRLVAFLETAEELTEKQQTKHITKIRRDCQRLKRMLDHFPGVCTKMLDEEWAAYESKDQFLRSMLKKANLSAKSIDSFLNYTK